MYEKRKNWKHGRYHSEIWRWNSVGVGGMWNSIFEIEVEQLEAIQNSRLCTTADRKRMSIQMGCQLLLGRHDQASFLSLPLHNADTTEVIPSLT